MEKRILQTVILISAMGVILAIGFILPAMVTSQAKPIVIGCPVSMGVYYGPDCRDAQLLAIKEINAAGGVNVGGQKRTIS